MSLPEILLWRELKTRPRDFKFRKQHPAGPYVLDFYCVEASLCVEVDGATHNMGTNPQRDKARDRWVAEQGIRTVRFAAADVMANVEAVLIAIQEECASRSPSTGSAGPPPLQRQGRTSGDDMTSLETDRIALSTGVTLNVCLGGPRGEGTDTLIFLHGFPESHRTWRHQMGDLSRDHFVVAPDQRGFAASDKPEGDEHYATGKMVEDLIALADALEIDRFTLVGHDWGGIVAWLGAMRHPKRVERLVIVNAPHPLLFQKTLCEDEAQREASQYVNAFKSPLMEAGIAAMGYETFFDKTFGGHVDLSIISEEEKQHYIADWSQPGAMTAMLNWYRASDIEVPPPGEEKRAPVWTHLPMPRLAVPTLVVWALKDKALLPIQLEGLAALVKDLRIATTPTAGHFVPWEEPDTVTAAIRAFLEETAIP
jgi:pimeloyl-ACP methyl ester carboxylesterase/very-short-patch-repair endonuclease